MASFNTNTITNIYLACFGSLFAIYSKHKSGYSLELNHDQCIKLNDIFESIGIPFRNSIDVYDHIDGRIIEDDSPANSRVVIKIEGEDYNVLNFDAGLIKNYCAEMISKAFEAKDIESRVELLSPFKKSK